jgi:thiamine-monophosphate kinase
MRCVAEPGYAEVATDGTIGELGEFDLIDRLTQGLSANKHVILGPGDDTAIVSAPDGRTLVTVDILVEDRHFRRDWSTPVDIGRKAAAASLADIAAMGGVATSLVVAFAAPADLPASWAVQCMSGLAEEAALVGASIVGGDISAADSIVISVTALGDLRESTPVLRAGALVRHLAVDNLVRELELVDHAKRNGTTAGLTIVHLALEHVCLDALLLQHQSI